MRERHKSTAAQLHSDMRMCQGAMEHERVSGELRGAQQTRHSGETTLASTSVVASLYRLCRHQALRV